MKIRNVARMVALVAVLAGFPALPAAAQERGAGAVEFAAGALMFPDEGLVTEGFAGGAGRFYVTPRISIGPEVAFITGDNQTHLMLTGNLTVDLGSSPRVTPFVVVGGGLFRTTDSFPDNQTSSHNEGA